MNNSSPHRLIASSRNKPRLLCLIQLPPPVHGAALTNQFAMQSPLLNETFALDILPLRFAESVGDIGRLSPGKLWRTLVTAGKLGWRLLTRRPKAVYFTLSPVGGAFLRDLLLIAVMKLFFIPRIYHLRGKGIARASAEKSWLQPLYRWAFDGAEVIHLSTLLYPDIEEYVPRDRLHIVANGRPQPQGPIADHALQSEPPIILFVSTMMEAKGPLVLLDALRQLQEEDAGFRAVFVGPWLTDRFRRQWEEKCRALGLGQWVEYRGALYGDELVAMYKQADILAFPTLNECFPGVVLEAMSYALPVIASKEGALPEIVEHDKTGLIVPKNDPGPLAEALHELLMDKNRRLHMGAAGFARFEQHYTLPAFENRLHNALLDCLGVE